MERQSEHHSSITVSLHRAICLHESAHATLCFRTGLAWIAADSKIHATDKDGGTEGCFLTAEAEAIATLAGPLATKMILGCEDGAASDYREVIDLANQNGGMPTAERWIARTLSFLSEQSTRSAITRLADALEQRKQLTGREVEGILQPYINEWWPPRKDTRRFPRILRSKRSEPSPVRGAFESGAGSKTFKVVKDGDRIVDYQDVTIEGYLSTFRETTESDRQGDYVVRGAFTQTIKPFLRNPVLLVDHLNLVENVAGRFVELREDQRGLWFKAELSNSATERMREIRALVAEGHLRTVSMGGMFHYKEDGRGIFKVDLFEGSLTPVPANPDALFSVRQLN